MLTKLQAYSSWPSVTSLLAPATGREETDLIQIRNIEGLDPVKASINTTPFGSIDGASFTGSGVDTRNIVLTLRPNPDWATWTFESLRKLLYKYFMPKSLTRLIFYSSDISPVDIYGYVEDFSVNQFTNDPEIQVSIICPDPYFTSVNPTIVAGESSNGMIPTIVNYAGDVEAGLNLAVHYVDGVSPTYVRIEINGTSYQVPVTLGEDVSFVMNSIPGAKYVRTVDLTAGVLSNLLSKITTGSVWPKLVPGDNKFAVVTDQVSHQIWSLTYYTRYGGL